MNQRIEELIEQSTNIEYGVDNGFDRVTFDKEKFAELIVKECMSLCADVEEDVELAEYVGGFRDGALMCREDIKEHFGVEE
jgi:hypothetical protein